MSINWYHESGDALASTSDDEGDVPLCPHCEGSER